MKSNGKKITGVHEIGPSAYKPESVMRLEGAHAKGLASMPMNKTAKIMVHGMKTAHRVNQDGSHSVEITPNKVTMGSSDEKNSNDAMC